MLSITELKKGTLITLDNLPFRVIEYNQKQVGRGGSIVNVKLKNLLDGTNISKTFKGNDKIEPAQMESVTVQYLYADNDGVHFMRSDTYEQVEISQKIIGDDVRFLTEGMEVSLLYINGKPLVIDLPIKLEYQVIEADPGIKGDSAGSIMKSCTIETGLVVQVPLFINVGDKIRIDTRSVEYVERV